MTVYIIVREFEVGDPYERELVSDIVGCTLSKEAAEEWCSRAVEQEIYFDSQFTITEMEMGVLPEVREDGEDIL